MTSSFIDTGAKHLTHFVFGTYIIFMLGFFFIPNAVDQYKFFSVAVFLPALPLLPCIIKATGYDRLLLLLIVYLTWMLLTSFWSVTFSVEELFKTLRLALYIVTFVLLATYLAMRKPAVSEAYLTVLVIAATVAAVVSVPLWYSDHAFPGSRIIGIGTLDNPNPSAFVYGFFSVIGCHLALAHHNLWLKLVFSLCTVLLAVFVFLTQSNTGILATISSISLLLLLRHGGRSLQLAGGVLVALGTLLFLSYSLGILEKPMDSGFAQRIFIWETVIEQIEQAPLIGHGYQKQLLLDVKGLPDAANYTHNALLASFRDGGLIAVTIHFLVLATALLSASAVYKRTNDPAYLAYLLFGLICMSADTDQLITRPRELWIIFWWPLAMIIADRILQRAGNNSSGDKLAE